jgi:hypothetical protein
MLNESQQRHQDFVAKAFDVEIIDLAHECPEPQPVNQPGYL